MQGTRIAQIVLDPPVTGGTVITPAGPTRADVLIDGGTIAAIGNNNLGIIGVAPQAMVRLFSTDPAVVEFGAGSTMATSETLPVG